MSETRPLTRPTPAPELGDGWLLDSHGVAHESMADFLGSVLGLCGCAEEEPTLDRVHDVLDAIEGQRFDEFRALLRFDEDPAAFYLATCLLDVRGLVEHGTSIRAGWLTDDGRLYLEMLREWRATQPPKLGAWVEIAEIPTRNDEVTHTQAALDTFRRAVADLGGAATERDHGTDERTARSAQVLDPVTGARIGEVEILVDRQRSALVVRVRRGAP